MTSLATVETRAVGPATEPVAIVELLRLAIEKQIPVESLEKLQALHERVSDRAAAAEFAQAMAQFQHRCPSIGRNAVAKVTSAKTGASYSYRYAELDHIATTIRPILRDVGLSYTWDSETKGETITCRCTVRHLNGHSQTASFAAPAESRAGMSEQQKHAAALTYARRQSLIQALGLTTCDPDTDAANPTPISADEVLDLEALITEVGANKDRFLAFMGVKSLEAIPKREMDRAVNALRARAKAKP